MAIWELKCGSVNEFASIVSRDYDNIEDELFDTDGGPKDWKDRPLVGYAVDKRHCRKRLVRSGHREASYQRGGRHSSTLRRSYRNRRLSAPPPGEYAWR